MNKLEKALVWALGWDYKEEDRVTVAVWHLVSSHKSSFGLEKTYTMNWLPFTLDIPRPETGRMKLNYVCRHCGKSMAFNVTSKKNLEKYYQYHRFGRLWQCIDRSNINSVWC